MTDHRQPVLGDVFGPCDVLPVAARRRLAALLAVPGRSPALLPGELGSLPLPGGRDERAAVQATIEEGLSHAVSQLAGLRMDEVVPAIRGRDGGVVGASWPARLCGLLERNQVTSWALLAELAVGDVGSWSGAGPVVTASLVGRVVEAGLDVLAEGGGIDASSPGTVAVGASDVWLLLGHERQIGRNEVRVAIERCMSAGHLPDVRAAASRLLAGPAEHDPCLAFLDRALNAAGDDRDRCVFEHLLLALDSPVTRGELGAALGIGPERVRQLRARAEERVRAVIGDAPEPVGQRAAALAEHLGVVAPATAAGAALAAGGMPALPDSRSRLLLWIAGPYQPVDGHAGWVSTEPDELLAETRRLIHEDGGVRPVEQVAKELRALGVVGDNIESWLAGQPVRIIEDLVIATTGSSRDVAERALFACGRAMTVVELASWASPVGGEEAAAALGPLLGRDPRFLRVGPDRFELADWGSERYDDRISLVGGDPGASPEWAEPERSWLRVEVDDGVVAGSAAAVPVELLASLGVRRGARRTFATRYGPVALAHDAGRPTRGSLRPVALAVGASVGDTLLLGFHHHEDAAVVELAR